MAQNYVRPPFPHGQTLDPDREFMRESGAVTLWCQWRNPSRKNVTVTFLVVGVSDDGTRFEVVDVSHRVARLAGTLIDTQGGARVPLRGGDVAASIAGVGVDVSVQVHGVPGRFMPRFVVGDAPIG